MQEQIATDRKTRTGNCGLLKYHCYGKTFKVGHDGIFIEIKLNVKHK